MAIKASRVYLIFALSGAAGLIYQVTWARWLGLVFGNTTLSVTIVLGCFMLGLALGSRLAGRFLSRMDDPLACYAAMELGIGAFALACPWITRFADRLFTLAITSTSLTAYGILMRTVISAGVLLLPTTLMGTTFPLLADLFHREPAQTRHWRTGLLYAANTLGAALGIAAAGFVLIELFGVLTTTRLAAAMNLLAAWLAYRLSGSSKPAQDKPVMSAPARPNPSGRLALAVIAWSGALALASEVLWTRTLETIVGNSSYAFSAIVVLYLCGIAAGSWLMSMRLHRLKDHSAWLAATLLGMGLWTAAATGLFGAIASSLAGYGGKMVPLSTIFGHYLEVISLLAPLALLSGACFPLATRLMEPGPKDASGASAARVYGWNTLGSVAGSLAAGFLIAPHWDYVNSLELLAALYGLGAAGAFAVLAVFRRQARQGRRPAAGLALAAAAVALLCFAKASDKSRYAASFEAKHPPYRMVFHKAGLQGVTSVAKDMADPRKDILFVNGAGMTVKATDTKMMAHLPMLLHPDPQDTLVICLGMGTTYRSALSHGGKVTVVELVQEVVEAFDRFHADAPKLKSDPRGRMVVNDGRNFLKLTRESFDVITVDPPPPIDAAGVNNLYSKEFLELAQARLKPGGIMAHWIPYPGTMSGVDDDETADMLLATFAQVFPYVYVHSSGAGLGIHVLGSRQPIPISQPAIEKRLSNKAVARDMNEWDRVPRGFLSTGWITPLPRHLAMRGTTDDKPLLEFFLLKTAHAGGKKMHASNFW